MIRRLAVVGVLFGWLATATPALAAPVSLDFGTGLAGIGGVITLSGPNVTGANIPIGVLNVLGTAFDGAYVMSGILTFDTLANTISIVGGIPGLGIAAGTTLLSGSFSTFSFLVTSPSTASFTGQGPDVK